MEISKELKLACKNFIEMLKISFILTPSTTSLERYNLCCIVCCGMLTIESNSNVIVIDKVFVSDVLKANRITIVIVIENLISRCNCDCNYDCES